MTAPKYDTVDTHGTGCTLSSAIAAYSSHGFDLESALVLAKAYVQSGLEKSSKIGKGPGPVTHTGFVRKSKNFPWVTKTAHDGINRPKSPSCAGILTHICFPPY